MLASKVSSRSLLFRYTVPFDVASSASSLEVTTRFSTVSANALAELSARTAAPMRDNAVNRWNGPGEPERVGTHTPRIAQRRIRSSMERILVGCGGALEQAP